MNNINKMNDARLKVQLDKLYNIDGTVNSLGQFIESGFFTSKKIFIQTLTSKRINLCYEELEKRKVEYYLCFYSKKNDVNLMICVPKMVFDYVSLPDETNNQTMELLSKINSGEYKTEKQKKEELNRKFRNWR